MLLQATTDFLEKKKRRGFSHGIRHDTKSRNNVLHSEKTQGKVLRSNVVRGKEFWCHAHSCEGMWPLCWSAGGRILLGKHVWNTGEIWEDRLQLDKEGFAHSLDDENVVGSTSGQRPLKVILHGIRRARDVATKDLVLLTRKNGHTHTTQDIYYLHNGCHGRRTSRPSRCFSKKGFSWCFLAA